MLDPSSMDARRSRSIARMRTTSRGVGQPSAAPRESAVGTAAGTARTPRRPIASSGVGLEPGRRGVGRVCSPMFVLSVALSSLRALALWDQDWDQARTLPRRRRAHRGSGSSRRSATRARVLYRDAYRCQLCRRAAAEVDHIVPVIDGGTDDPANLRSLCHDCHAGREPQPCALSSWGAALLPHPDHDDCDRDEKGCIEVPAQLAVGGAQHRDDRHADGDAEGQLVIGPPVKTFHVPENHIPGAVLPEPAFFARRGGGVSAGALLKNRDQDWDQRSKERPRLRAFAQLRGWDSNPQPFG
jgi:hypothetical protein